MIEYPGTFWKDYELVDSGDGEKLERFGTYQLIRPEPKALWAKSMSDKEWERAAHTRFRPGAGFGKAGKEDCGTWRDSAAARTSGIYDMPARRKGPRSRSVSD